MPILSCTIAVETLYNGGVVSRILPAARRGEGATTQTLLLCGRQLRPLAGTDAHSGLELEPPLQLYADPAARDGEPAAARPPYLRTGEFWGPVWDPFSSAVYAVEGNAVVRLSSDNTMTVVAGKVEQSGSADGPGRAACFILTAYLTSDGAGSLYVTSGSRIRKLQLPGGWAGQEAPQLVPQAAAGVAPAAALAAVPSDPVGGEARDNRVAAAAAEDEVVVSTLPLEAAGPIRGLAFDGSGSNNIGTGRGSLLFSTATALYCLPLGDPAAAPSVVVGAQGEPGTADGRGADARFTSAFGIVMDGDGCVYMADWMDNETTSVRRVTANGVAITIVAGLEGCWGRPAILPNGCLTLCGSRRSAVHVLGLGLKPPGCHTAPPPIGPLPRTLPGDLGALLGRQPDGTTDVAIVVGGRTFHVHRALLSARCDYFQQRLGGSFTDGSAQQLDLPDADPEAFEVVLLFVYTGTVNIPVALAAGVAELADRLLLPELCEQAVALVEASVSACTVAGLLLWAEARSPAFAELLSRLKGWYVENHEAVVREAKEEVGLLMARNPQLFLELMLELPSKRPRTH
ncbi:ARM REPEAT PROTEIN INTERACTING WITH ABF2 [Tetrabaena socialis]|uniref:ARM REPEAT PROTEIN INTERACTING WITH ABF2 n=1 Tax=Tetrabaena socialis TaxID=47790 RepID=A0A2J7ZQB0_9CHLO|nr:ARM REPEAT PROTEIN INTERACTING WITH ABF2 [Tetrabaena socialis]|eukprot:PNH02453.1 ARM REPEAT PROTEIN INTERACTING WITH ABF2 [Tetrabaena socialis]